MRHRRYGRVSRFACEPIGAAIVAAVWPRIIGSQANRLTNPAGRAAKYCPIGATLTRDLSDPEGINGRGMHFGNGEWEIWLRERYRGTDTTT
jgi:hypothetical protein